MAKFSTRLVPDQDFHEIERLVVEHMRRMAPPEVRVEVRIIHGGAPALTELDHPSVAVAASALEAAFGKPPVFLRSGGTIPAVALILPPNRGNYVPVRIPLSNQNLHRA